MKKREVSIDQGRIVPLFPRLLLTGLIITLLIYLIDLFEQPGPTFYLGFMLGTFILHALWSARKILLVKFDMGTIHHFFWLLGLKIREQNTESTGIELFVRKKQKDRKSPGRYPYEVILKLENGQEIFVISRDYPEDALHVAEKIAKKLGIKVKK